MKKTIIALSISVGFLTSCKHDTTCYCTIEDINGLKYPSARYPLGNQYKKIAESKCRDKEIAFEKNGNYSKEKTNCNISQNKKDCIGTGSKFGGL